MSSSNPFAALLGTDVESSENDLTNSNELNISNDHTKVFPLVEVIEEIFGLTLNPERSRIKGRLLLQEFEKHYSVTDLNLNILNEALFERLFMFKDDEDASKAKATISNPETPHVCEHQVLIYLHVAYRLLKNCNKLTSNDKETIENIIITNASTAVMQPDIYVGQNLAEQFYIILKESQEYSEVFFSKVAKEVLDNENFCSLIKGICDVMSDNVKTSSLGSLDYTIFACLKSFLSESFLAEYLIDNCFPTRKNVGSDFANTIIGALLNLSVLPKVPLGKFEHFTEPMDQNVISRNEGLLWTSLDNINSNTFEFFLTLLKKNSKIKEKVLTWVGTCLKTNADRGKLWNSQAPHQLNPTNYTTVTDGFMLNMCNVMLRLCEPFISDFKDNKILKVDPTYCAVTDDKLASRGIHISGLSKETCIVPEDPEEQRVMANSYNFITECFFMTHRTLDLGFRVCVDKLIRLNHKMGQLERTLNEAVAGGSQDTIETLRDTMNSQLSEYFSIKCQLSEPIMLANLFNLIASTCYWLCQVCLHNEYNNNTYAPLENIKVEFPLSDSIPKTLQCIPEFIVENIVSTLTFIKRFNPKVFEEEGYEKMEPILTFILMYMGSRERVRNPHLRAKLAEALESLLPYHKDDSPVMNNISSYQRKKLFAEHPHRLQIVTSLLEVFVGIELTGQSVEFEQKFNYRRPMYAVIDYIWNQSEQVKCLEILADYAEQNMEAVNPPLFLRFANLLINDAIFLLDEALSNMAKIKETQSAQQNEELNRLPARERSQQLEYRNQIGMLARFDNILGKDTISTLEKLTFKIQKVFTHATMVDRIASMLNYFLLSLVGPNKKNFKVNNPKEYSFDPKGMVIDICKIYTNLRNSDTFILAISQDGRSYSPQLFTYAEEVLSRIGGGNLMSEMKDISQKVEAKAKAQKDNEEAAAEAPDHFLDPIMSTLMLDPVILPSSKQTVDRTTIARHLLSDQTDPFNRSPLSMDQVISNTELAEEIKKWLVNRKIESNS